MKEAKETDSSPVSCLLYPLLNLKNLTVRGGFSTTSYQAILAERLL
jgi:hypothetical protein